jgi:hypothetical protein
MIQVLKTVFYFGPLLFGFGFLAPLTAQIVVLSGWAPPFDLSPLMTGLIVGGGLGLLAQIRGRWI